MHKLSELKHVQRQKKRVLGEQIFFEGGTSQQKTTKKEGRKRCPTETETGDPGQLFPVHQISGQILTNWKRDWSKKSGGS